MAAPGENLRINGDRLWDSLMEMAKIGPGVAGGNNRQTLTDEDGEGRALFQTWCEAEGCTMGLDQMGNMFARREGSDPEALPVYVGSHLDTQPTGGKYDGVLGVLGGLEIIRSLNDMDIKTKHPIVVTNFTNEEGTRFAPAMLASGVFAGVHTQDWAYERTDSEGKSFGDELKRIGWRGEEEVGARKMHAFFELHIEQGPILEAEDVDIGVVTHGQGLSWTQVTITGKDAHTGSTPMPMRKNAGLGMARILDLVDEIALSHAPHAVGAAGHIDVYPNSRNVIPGKVVFTVDFRCPNIDIIADMETRLKAGAQKICDDMGLSVEFEKVGGFDEEGEGHRKQDERDVVVVDARILKQRVEGQNPEKQSAVEHERVTHQKLGNARWGGNSVVSHASWNDPHFLTVATECHGGGEFTEPLNRVALECL